jgi:hypothetical protein
MEGYKELSCVVVVEYVTAIADGRVHKTIKGTALPGPDQKIRLMNELTMDKARELASPKRPNWDVRI